MSVIKLNSLHLLFQALEKQQIETFTSRLIILMRDGGLTLPQQRVIHWILKKVSPLTNSATFIYTLATSLITMEVTDLKEKSRLTWELIDLTDSSETSSDILEMVAGATMNLMLEDGLSLETKKELLAQVYRMTLSRNATPEVIDIYARSLFNISVDEPTMEGKRAYTSRLRTLAFFGRGTVNALIQAAKAHVNLSYLTRDESECVECLSVLEKLVRKPTANPELRLIYVNGLFNFIIDDTNQETLRKRYFRKLKKLAQSSKTTWDIRKMYVKSLMKMALDTENIREKRRYVRQIVMLVEMPGCTPEILEHAARAVFNHHIDEASLKSKKKYLLVLKKILERSDNSPMVLREYVRSLVNMVAEDPDYENKRQYSNQIQKFTKMKNPSLDVVLEYAKSLLNLALSDESEEDKLKDLTTLLNIDQEIHYKMNNLAENTPVDYLCVKAEALTLLLMQETNPLERRKILFKIPRVNEIKESTYFKVFVDLFQDSLNDEKDWFLRQKMQEMLDSYSEALKVFLRREELMKILELVREEDVELPPELVKELMETFGKAE